MATLTICGGGNAAHVLAALAPQAGWAVKLFAPFGDEAARLHAASDAAGGFTVRFTDGREVTGQPRHISVDPAQVIPGATLVLLALPAFAHGLTLAAIAPYLDVNAAVGALPARSGFDFQAHSVLAARGLPGRLFGLQTLPWACRITAYGREAAVLGVKATVDVAFDPPDGDGLLGEELQQLLGIPLRPVRSFLALTLANTGQIIHPGVMYGLCRGHEEATFSAAEIPLFYQGVDDATADVLQAMSDDVQRLAAALQGRLSGFDAGEVVPLHEWLRRAYPEAIADATTLRAALATNRAYHGLRLPVRMTAGGAYQVDYRARYLAEDVPFGLVVVRGIAQLAAVPTPALDEVIRWAEARTGRRYLTGDVLEGPDVNATRAPQAYGIHRLDALGAWARGRPARSAALGAS